jgi:hypothetical protein
MRLRSMCSIGCDNLATAIDASLATVPCSCEQYRLYYFTCDWQYNDADDNEMET